jgi:hypothetical protein
MTPLTGVAWGLLAGTVVAVALVMVVLAFGVTRDGITEVPGTVTVQSNDRGFSMETGSGVLVPPLVGGLIGAWTASRRGIRT